MNIVVQKMGGSSVATTDKLFNVCRRIIEEKENGKDVVVVVSAQGKTTDRLIEEEKEITDTPNKREHDMLVSVGEQITIAKLSMCLRKLGYDSVSFLGWQVPIITDSNYTDANILKIKTNNIVRELKKGNIVIVAGFQGVDRYNNITTLGRGGSDTTAIALAAALNAEKCELFKDVDGVYSNDPKKYQNATIFKKISYDKMLELSNNGAKVLQNKSVEIAKQNKIKVLVRSIMNTNTPGTVVEN